MKGPMAKSSKDLWNERYSGSEFVWSTTPNQFLPPQVEGLPPGRAVDLACGEGRNAVWLAQQGWSVTGVDFAQAGLDKAERLARDHNVDIAWECGDATQWIASEPVDLAILFYFHLPPDARRRSVVHAAKSLAPGGVLLVVGHDASNIADGYGGPQDPALLFDASDITADIASVGLSAFAIEEGGRVPRTVDTPDGPKVAWDCLVRAVRVVD